MVGGERRPAPEIAHPDWRDPDPDLRGRSQDGPGVSLVQHVVLQPLAVRQVRQCSLRQCQRHLEES